MEEPDIDKRIAVGLKIPLDVGEIQSSMEEFLALTQTQITFASDTFSFAEDNPLTAKWYDEVEKKLYFHFEHPILT